MVMKCKNCSLFSWDTCVCSITADDHEDGQDAECYADTWLLNRRLSYLTDHKEDVEQQIIDITKELEKRNVV
jgi:hypothetical protein